MDSDKQDSAVLAAAIGKLPEAIWPGGYDETGLSLLDAVYSVNANYETTTRKVIERYRDNRAGQADKAAPRGVVGFRG